MIENILLAEDDDDDSDFFQDAVSEIPVKAKVIRVKDGIELMKELQHEESLPDLLFLDINMPRKNGFQCLTEIRESEKHKGLPVIIFSTSSASDIISYMFNAGANGFIIKPNDFNKWKTIIEKTIKLDWKKSKPHGSIKNFVISEI